MGRIYSSAAAQFEYMGREGFLHPSAQNCQNVLLCKLLTSNVCTAAVNCILLCNFWPVTNYTS